MPEGCNPYPCGSRIEIWWAGDRAWYAAHVTCERIEMHTLKGVKTRCYEILCHYELDDLTQWHSLHNNKVRMASNAGDVCGGACPPTPVTHQIRMTPL